MVDMTDLYLKIIKIPEITIKINMQFQESLFIQITHTYCLSSV